MLWYVLNTHGKVDRDANECDDDENDHLEYLSNLFSRKMMQNCTILTVDLLNFYELPILNNIS